MVATWTDTHCMVICLINIKAWMKHVFSVVCNAEKTYNIIYKFNLATTFVKFVIAFTRCVLSDKDSMEIRLKPIHTSRYVIHFRVLILLLHRRSSI